MTGRDDLDDPALNYTRGENQPFGVRLPEYAIRQVIGYNFKLVRQGLSEPRSVLDDLFASIPTEIPRIKAFFRDHKNLQATVNFPGPDAMLPVVCVVNKGEIEDSKFSFVGDHVGTYRTGLNGSGAARRVRGVGEARSVEVIIGTTDPDLTLFLHAFVKTVVHANKHQLAELYDVQDMVVSGRDLQLDQNVAPQLGFYKSVVIQFRTLFEWADLEDLPQVTSVRLGLLVEAMKDDDPFAETLVPGEQG